MFALIPVVEAPYEALPFEWAARKKFGSYVRLSRVSSGEDASFFLALLAVYNELASEGTIDETARVFLEADELVLPGGLMPSAECIEIPLGCCCGLEGWREWFDLAPDGDGPWLGHDPWPWVECKSECAVIWADKDLGDRSPSIVVTYTEIDAATDVARDDLLGFTETLTAWLSRHSSIGVEVSRHIARKFDIPIEN